MTFDPPRCPNRLCKFFEQPGQRFFIRKGVYRAKCRPEPVPRFSCKGCGKGFSRQTFRHDYRDRKPHCNVPLFRFLISSSGLRQAARQVGLSVHAVQKKARKIAKTCGFEHGNLCRQLPGGRTWLLDEEETFEHASIRTLTMPLVIDRDTRFLVATAVGPIRRLAKTGSLRRLRQDREELRLGVRPDTSDECVRAVLRRLCKVAPEGAVTLLTDEKPSYARIAGEVFGERLIHLQVSSRRIRKSFNPLFPMNSMIAMSRDNCGRLRRKSWLVSKRGEYLQLHMQIFAVYRNYVRPRFNRDRREECPAVFLGLLPRALEPDEVLAWRQDWGLLSIHPLSRDGKDCVAVEQSAA